MLCVIKTPPACVCACVCDASLGCVVSIPGGAFFPETPEAASWSFSIQNIGCDSDAVLT